MNAATRTVLSMSACLALGFSSAVMLGFGGAPGAEPHEGQPVSLDAVPAAVKAAVQAHAPGATHEKAWKVVENDTTFYSLRGKAKDGDKIEFKALESGRLVEVIHDMTPDKVPADVTDQIKKLLPSATITGGERHMGIRWRIEVKDGDKMKEVILRADGKHIIREAEAPTKPATK